MIEKLELTGNPPEQMIVIAKTINQLIEAVNKLENKTAFEPDVFRT